MVERSNGYKNTKVSGTDFKIKEQHEGSELGTLGRRLAAYNDGVSCIVVEWDGTIDISVRASDTFTIGFGNDIELDHLPDDYTVERLIVHDSSRASASLTITPFE